MVEFKKVEIGGEYMLEGRRVVVLRRHETLVRDTWDEYDATVVRFLVGDPETGEEIAIAWHHNLEDV